MYIPSYQIHNVLKVYSRQVSQSRIIERQKELSAKTSADKIDISAEGKRKMIVDKVAADIVDRITQFGPRDPIEQDIVNQLQNELGKPVDSDEENEQDQNFVFNIIDDENKKTTNSMSMEGTHFITKRLEQLAKEEIDRNMEK
ncbi:MAG TPA: hypothetical protein HPQ03_16170 [Deltaproteobacteria bacterium]|nr:hypothetical protein [Deltaproteobacteria bacterium]